DRQKGHPLRRSHRRQAPIRPTRKVLDECQKNFGNSWRAVREDTTQAWPYLTEGLTKFQDPAEADKLFKIQRDLDQTKIISSRQFSALAQGEELDSLVEKSSDLRVKKKKKSRLLRSTVNLNAALDGLQP
ncbi:unnamed protein product, partial [Musa acuminata subsp. burmannicoides]